MHPEDEYIKKQFEEIFLAEMDNPIVLYGIGVRTENLLNNVCTSRIIGLMDSKHTGEYMFGKKVLDYNEVKEIPDVIIVIIARNSVIGVIYRRIVEFVNSNKIKVFDVNGNNLGNTDIEAIEKECFKLKEEELKKHIEDSDVVSFDIFDTLICRNVMRPQDVFELLGESFAKDRKRAEAELSYIDSPDIYEIYKQMKDDTKSSEDVHALVEKEIDIELKVLKRREEMCNILESAKKQGKKVLLISDMYFTKEIITQILDAMNITEYDELYVSSEFHKSKANGLFDIVRQKEGIDGRWLHIGDDEYADILVPRNIGVDTYRVYSTTAMLEHSIYSRVLNSVTSLEENVVFAKFAAIAFNNPFSGFDYTGKICISSAERLAQIIFAPVIFKYMIWLVDRIIKEAIDTVWFPSRDGYLLQILYEKLCDVYQDKKLPKGRYIYTSRRAAMVAAAKTDEDIMSIVDFPGQQSQEKKIYERFGITAQDEYLSKDYLERVKQVCDEERKNYLAYLEKCGLDSAGKIALIDFVSIGTVHNSLQKMTGKQIQGYYFLRRKPDTDEKRKLDIEALYGTFGDFEMDTNLYRYYYFLELLLTSYEPSLKSIDSDCEPCFYDENRKEEDIETIKTMHNGIIDYCSEMFRILFTGAEWSSSIKIYDEILGFFSKDYSDIQPGIIDGMRNIDEFMDRTVSDMNR